MMTASGVVAIRDSLRMTQAEFAAALGVSLKAVWGWEHGATVTAAKEQRMQALAVSRGVPVVANPLAAHGDIELLTELIRRAAARLAQPTQSQTGNSDLQPVTESGIRAMNGQVASGGAPVNGDDGVGSDAARGTRQDQQAEHEANAGQPVQPVKRAAPRKRRRAGG